MNDLQRLMASEIEFTYFSDFGFPITYTPNQQTGKGNPILKGAPVTILAVPTISETGRLTAEGDRQRYHKVATLLVRQCDGPFGSGDEFTFAEHFGEAALDWKYSGSSSTLPMDTTQVIELLSKQLYEIGDFRRKQ